ncbi:MAG: FAD binding domain-containing protein, partial [Chloroflexi bacterium]|nr:FAD binding domain-containing protein [Chloroflexota bacterium]
MWPNKFDYVRAGSVDEALASAADGGKFLAGGHSLLPAMKLRLDSPEQLIDIGRIPELKGISANGGLTIGAGATHDEIATSADVQAMCRALASACGQVGDQGVRNFGTIGGNIAHADPASDPPTVLVACGATVNIQGADGSR